MESVYGRTYQVGCAPCLLYAAHGLPSDWICKDLNVTASLAFEVRPGRKTLSEQGSPFFFVFCYHKHTFPLSNKR